MTAEELLELVRTKVQDDQPDYLFSDDEIYFAMAAAQREAALRTHILKGVVPLTIPAGSSQVDLPEYVLEPQTVRYGGRVYEVHDLDKFSRLSQSNALVFGHDMSSLIINREASSDMDLTLKAVLLPRNDPSDANQTLELPAQFHYALLPGVVYYLLQTFDADMENDARLQRVAARWAQSLNNMRLWAAKHIRKPRTVRYGGIT